jgi:vacuolar iron transporter family protein
MPITHHHERHFMASDAVRDILTGMSDGLTVPFALAAGLSAALVGSGTVVAAGLAEIAAGAIAMGLGGYLAVRTDIEYSHGEYRREWHETEELTDPTRAHRSALTIGLSYIVGGLVPLLPYMLVGRIGDAFHLSIGATLLALLLFGAIKGGLTGVPSWRAGVQTATVGGLAAAVAFTIAHLVARGI